MTKTQLETSLRDARIALAFSIKDANHTILVARRAIRQFPDCRLFPHQLSLAVRAHLQAKQTVTFCLSEAFAAAVRQQAAQFLRRDLESYRENRRRKAAAPVAAPIALAA